MISSAAVDLLVDIDVKNFSFVSVLLLEAFDIVVVIIYGWIDDRGDVCLIGW